MEEYLDETIPADMEECVNDKEKHQRIRTKV